MTTDYRDTVFLPRTDFPMKADLPRREPEAIARWDAADLYRRLREASAGRPKFILHDGPPYANGHLHMGTALNKILKDVVNRGQQMLGQDAPYVPGWDCHGLPIEWQIEQEYRKKGKDKDAVPIVDFRRECREFAQRWIDIQRAEFKRLGVLGDWDDPYTTMNFAAEAGIYRELGKFLLSGALYRGKKSVMWSVVEKTALAEAEVEYHDHTSTTIWVRFPLTEVSRPDLVGGGRRSIWTTTPWTIPANRAVAYGENIAYRLIEVGEVGDGWLARTGRAAGDRGRAAGRGRRRPPASSATGRWPSSTARRSPAASPAIRSPAMPMATASPCRCWPATSSPPSRAPASSTSPRATARTISSWVPATASRSRTRWPRTAPTPARCPASRACTCSRRPSR